jgi:NAD-dependent dihydropyrimidine dehydrogenase PreA subunit
MALKHIYFDGKACNGCNTCVEVCMCDAFVPNPEKGKPPILKYPEECWFCGACVTDCPKKDQGAIRIVTPFQMRGSLLRR